MGWMIRVVALLALIALPASAQAPRRVALVIANANYAGYAPLPNTAVDAGLVADALRRAGFSTVEVKADQGIAGFRTALGAFQTRASGAEVAAIYYAGHGVEVGGRNWLIPTDARLETDAQLAFQAIDANLLVEAASGARTRLVVLDACRENPFAGRMRRTGRFSTRDAAPGLAAPIGEGARGTLLMYSAAPGELAADGVAGRGSPFARAFARYLPEQGVELRVSAGKIADAVYDETVKAQLPFTSSSLSGAEIYLVAGARAVTADLELDRLRREVETLRRSGVGTPAGPPAPSPASVMRSPAQNAGGAPAVPLLQPGQTFRDCADCPEMVVIPAGTFMMGSAQDALQRRDEGPVHRVAIRQFAVAKFEVRRSEWEAFRAQLPAQSSTQCDWRSPSYTPVPNARRQTVEQSSAHPVVCVSWTETQAYTRWLSRKTGRQYRLLTESEWEYVARGGSTTLFPWGDTPRRDRANYGENGYHGYESGADRWMYTSPGGSFSANGFGLFDMHGNVREWVQDCYATTYAGAPVDGSAVERENCTRVTRGGSFRDVPIAIASTYRNLRGESDREVAIGFRVAGSMER